MSERIDQLDYQLMVLRQSINKNFRNLQGRAMIWSPRPCPPDWKELPHVHDRARVPTRPS